MIKKTVNIEPITGEVKAPPEVVTVIKAKKESENDITMTPSSTLLAIPSTSYSLQLASLPNKSSVRRFFNNHPDLQGKTYLYHGTNSGNSKYVVLLGSFNSYRMAKLASKELKKSFANIDPWIKDYKTIHRDIK